MGEPIYVINGFYMAMREKYTKAGASIAYMVVEWDPAQLSWGAFRGKVLGATDPTAAEPGSVRRLILEQWKALGLSAEPNVGDNGVHASASPFEGLAERMNWVGASLEDDAFGQALLGAGVPRDTIMAWTKDPQVEHGGKRQSLFDLLEDLDAPAVLAKAQEVAGVTGPIGPVKNHAFVFVKPHAVTSATVALVKQQFAAAGVTITAEGVLDNQVILDKLLIDNHYYAIANKASLTQPKDLNPPAPKQEEFAALFGVAWPAALEQNLVFNAVDACAKLGLDGEQMDAAWAKAKKAGKLVKFGGGFYCGLVTPSSPPSPIYVINGFYMAMREKYTKAGASIAYMVVEWDPAQLSWGAFRGKVLGATDPTAAEPGSVRRLILEQWKALGLSAEPNVGDNGVHASASPFEGLAERMNWVGASLEDDAFGQALLGAGVPRDTIMAWTKDPQVEHGGKRQSLFDLLEDLDAPAVLAKAQEVAGVTGPVGPVKNHAFVFVKPHAVTSATVALVKQQFAAAGVTITAEGVLDNQVILDKLLIDNHYYAIANKASLTQPKDLNPPAPKQEEFAALFGVAWPAALEQGLVFNAVDACAKLGLDGEQMDAAWAKAKKAGKLVKFGGGFYCGLVTP